MSDLGRSWARSTYEATMQSVGRILQAAAPRNASSTVKMTN